MRGEGKMTNMVILFYFIYLFFGLFAFSRAAPMAYGGSQARDLIGAVGRQPTPELTATPDP